MDRKQAKNEQINNNKQTINKREYNRRNSRPEDFTYTAKNKTQSS